MSKTSGNQAVTTKGGGLTKEGSAIFSKFQMGRASGQHKQNVAQGLGARLNAMAKRKGYNA